MLLAGLVVFGAASLAGGFTTDPAQLVAARSVMGLGAAMTFPATLSLISNTFTERTERARAIGLWGAIDGLALSAATMALLVFTIIEAPGQPSHHDRVHGVLLVLPGGRPRGAFRRVIVPRSKISPPQTPCGSRRVSAPSRQGPRSGQDWQWALASSRSAGCPENHNSGSSRRHGSSPSRTAAGLANRFFMTGLPS
jgi:MFS family permease